MMTAMHSRTGANPFPLEVLPAGLGEEMRALAGATGVPDDVAAFACLTALSSAIGNSIHIETPMGLAQLNLQTVVLAPVHAEALQLVPLLLERIVVRVRALRQEGAKIRLEPESKPGGEPVVRMNPGTQKLYDEQTRRRAAASAPEFYVESLAKDAIAAAVPNCFDHAVLVTALGDRSKEAPESQPTEVLSTISKGFWGRLRINGRPDQRVIFSLLAMSPPARVAEMIQGAQQTLPWTILDAKPSSFSSLKPGPGLALTQHVAIVDRLLDRRIQGCPQTLTVAETALPILNQLVDMASAKSVTKPPDVRRWLEPAASMFFRIGGLLAVLADSATTCVDQDFALRSARVVTWWMDNQLRVAGTLGGRPQRNPTTMSPADVDADRQRLLSRFQKGGSKRWNVVRRGLPKRGKGFWDLRLSELANDGQIVITRVGTARFVEIRVAEPVADG